MRLLHIQSTMQMIVINEMNEFLLQRDYMVECINFQFALPMGCLAHESFQKNFEYVILFVVIDLHKFLSKSLSLSIFLKSLYSRVLFKEKILIQICILIENVLQN